MAIQRDTERHIAEGGSRSSVSGFCLGAEHKLMIPIIKSVSARPTIAVGQFSTDRRRELEIWPVPAITVRLASPLFAACSAILGHIEPVLRAE